MLATGASALEAEAGAQRAPLPPAALSGPVAESGAGSAPGCAAHLQLGPPDDHPDSAAEELPLLASDDLVRALWAQADDLDVAEGVALGCPDALDAATDPEASAIAAPLAPQEVECLAHVAKAAAVAQREAADALASHLGVATEEAEPDAVQGPEAGPARLAAVDAHDVGRTFVSARVGTLRRAKECLRRAARTHPPCRRALEHATSCIHRALALFDFVHTNAGRAIQTPHEALHSGLGVADPASGLWAQAGDGASPETSSDAQEATEAGGCADGRLEDEELQAAAAARRARHGDPTLTQRPLRVHLPSCSLHLGDSAFEAPPTPRRSASRRAASFEPPSSRGTRPGP